MKVEHTDREQPDQRADVVAEAVDEGRAGPSKVPGLGDGTGEEESCRDRRSVGNAIASASALRLARARAASAPSSTWDAPEMLVDSKAGVSSGYRPPVKPAIAGNAVPSGW